MQGKITHAGKISLQIGEITHEIGEKKTLGARYID